MGQKSLTLDAFVSVSQVGEGAYVLFPGGAETLYVRRCQAQLAGALRQPVLHLVQLDLRLEKQKGGTLKVARLVEHVKNVYPTWWLYVDDVQRPQLIKRLLELDFFRTEDSQEWNECFYRPPGGLHWFGSRANGVT